MGGRDDAMAERITLLWPHFDERQRRLLVGAEARAQGRGGVAAVARASGVSVPTVRRGMQELDGDPLPRGRVRRAGAGRRRSTDRDPGLVPALRELVDPETRGDPTSPLLWTTKSTRHLAEVLTEAGHPANNVLVAELLHQQGFSLQANRKTMEGAHHPDRDAQFRYINGEARRFLRLGLPVLSVDAKKKELVGAFKNGGQEWQPTKRPERVKVHDFKDPDLGTAIPYGVYDVGRNAGWVSVGSDHDTAAFAVEAIRRWWRTVGQQTYPRARRLLICADSGGSNGYRVKLWKVELARLASETGLSVTVCHLPPGTSKWNKIEHRLFAHISMNWRGRPLTSHEVIVELIGATTTRTGLTVHAERDTGTYPRGVKVTDEEIASVPLVPRKFHGEWNYTIRPRRAILTSV